MSVVMSNTIEKRDEEIAQQYLAGHGTTELASKYGVSRQTILNALKRCEITPRPPRGGRRRAVEIDVISPVHRLIGVEIATFRLKHKLLLTDIATELNISSHRIRLIEDGKYDLSLSELLKLCNYCSIDLVSLLEKNHERVKKSGLGSALLLEGWHSH